MQIIDFVSANSLESKTQAEKATLLCYFHYKENSEVVFAMSKISDFLVNAGFNAPNTTRLKDELTRGKGKTFLLCKASKGVLEFVPAVLQKMERNFGEAWTDATTIISDSQLIDETKFCGKRQFLDRLIKQINHSYAHNCYDACAVLMRRLFEILLILSYQNQGIDADIKDTSGSGYVMLEKIVINAKGNNVLKLSRIKDEFDTFRKVGNFSAHNITYTASKKDIDDIKLSYRVMLEELYNKTGFIA